MIVQIPGIDEDIGAAPAHRSGFDPAPTLCHLVSAGRER